MVRENVECKQVHVVMGSAEVARSSLSRHVRAKILAGPMLAVGIKSAASESSWHLLARYSRLAAADTAAGASPSLTQ
ncbi:hypothetical protein SK128_017608, partial [Halocaridina rubra]